MTLPPSERWARIWKRSSAPVADELGYVTLSATCSQAATPSAVASLVLPVPLSPTKSTCGAGRYDARVTAIYREARTSPPAAGAPAGDVPIPEVEGRPS